MGYRLTRSRVRYILSEAYQVARVRITASMEESLCGPGAPRRDVGGARGHSPIIHDERIP